MSEEINILIERVVERLITNKEEIFKSFDKESLVVYDYLQNKFNLKNENLSSDFLFQFIFRSFYRLDNAGLTKDIKDKYFELMDRKESDLRKILEELYHIKTLRKKESIQFSFATKLLHTLEVSNPIWDSKVEELFNLNPSKGKTSKERIDSCVNSYDKLKRILTGLQKKKEVKELIEEFKKKFKTTISEIKVLDFLLWTCGKIELDKKKEAKKSKSKLSKRKDVEEE